MPSSEISGPDAHRTRGVVLVVGGDDGMRAVTRKFCAMAGFATREAASAAQALAAIAASPPSGILCWSAIDDGDGLALARELRALVPDAKLVLVLDQGHLDRAHLAREIADTVLASPAALDQVLEVLRGLFARVPARRLPHLLIVDEDIYLANVLKRGLSASFDITVVPTAQGALGAIAVREPDAILAELRLLDMDVRVFHGALDAARQGLAGRTVYMTTGTVGNPIHAFLATIPGRWLYKPFPIATLRSLLSARQVRR
ncbi:MAG: hypothetical protein WKG01_27360 [Kofleriaceae bacterium]